jgi:hypothetical protein
MRLVQHEVKREGRIIDRVLDRVPDRPGTAVRDRQRRRVRVAATGGDWLPGICPEGRLTRDHRRLRCADLSSRPRHKEGSRTIHLDGPNTGWGFDHTTGESAGPIDLIAQATGPSDGAFFDEAARIAGMDRPAPRSLPRPKPDHSSEVARLVDGAQPLAGGHSKLGYIRPIEFKARAMLA